MAFSTAIFFAAFFAAILLFTVVRRKMDRLGLMLLMVSSTSLIICVCKAHHSAELIDKERTFRKNVEGMIERFAPKQTTPPE